MLTPAFEIQQNDTFLSIVIKAPYARVSDTEIFIEENEFRFHSKPYFLRLTLPGNIVEDGREEAKYDTDSGSYTINVPKETPGQHFEGLNMITKLLTPKGETSAKSPMIEVLSETCSNDTETGEEEDEEEFDWHIEQTPYAGEEPLLLDCPKYGFANQKSGIFSRLQDEVVDVVDLKTPDQCTMSDRKEQRQMAEQDKFDEDHYLADLYDDAVIQDLLCYDPLKDYDSCECFTDDDKEIMRNLPKKEYLIDNKLSVYLGLVDIIFAYCYDVRSTEGEENVESSWTISKLSSTLSWLDTFNSIEETLTACYRRCLCYPLYRNWEFNVKVHQDTAKIFSLGKEKLLKCLLSMHKCFSGTYPRYLQNDLYITDYCVWIQSADLKQLQSLTEAIEKCTIKKTDVGLNLIAIENRAAGAIYKDDIEDVSQAISKVNISKHDSDDESTDCFSTDDSGTGTETCDESTDSLTSATESDDELHDNDNNMHSENSTVKDTCNIQVKTDSGEIDGELDVKCCTETDKEITKSDSH